jgi:hypothetical protein
MSVKKGQIFLITIFIISIAMFSSLLAISPVRIKLIQIKDLEKTYQAMANAISGAEFQMTYDPLSGNPPPLNSSSIPYTLYSSDNTTTCDIFSTSSLTYCYILDISTSGSWLMIKIKYILFGDSIEKLFSEGQSGLLRRSINVNYY